MRASLPARDVRVIYTGRGMSKLQYVTDDWLQQTYGIRAEPYADFDLPKFDAARGIADDDRARIEQLAAHWGLRDSVTRVVAALTA